MKQISRVAVVYFAELQKEELVWSLLQAGFDAQLFDSNISIYSTDENDTHSFVKYIEENGIEAFITYDFCPALSDACEIRKVPYISWIYDCPHSTLYERSVTNEFNFIFSFDRNQAEKTLLLGGKHVYHQPLGTNMLRNSGTVIDQTAEEKFACDVSFVGNIYPDELYRKIEERASDTTRHEYNTIMADTYGKWDGEDRIHKKLSEDALTELDRVYYGSGQKKVDSDTFFASQLISRTLAGRERIEMLERLAKYGVQFFTGTRDVSIAGVTPRPTVDQLAELPQVYYLSRINLNITLHCITSGIPARVFEIMGVGGFVISNYQPEIEELFKIDKEIVVYRSFEELEEKVRYYLANERKRLEICINGYNAVKEKYDNERIVRYMIETACREL